jgi:purine-binding chemotaxis protein CheW
VNSTLATPAKAEDRDTAILRERAHAAARPLPTAPQQADAAGVIEVLEFRLADEQYAVETRWVHEVHPLRQLTPLPCTPPFVAGIVNVRGQVVTVLDLKRFFGLPQRGLTDLHRIVRIGSGEAGLLADLTVQVKRLAHASLQPPLPTQTGLGGPGVLGVASGGVVVLDAEKLLADPRLRVEHVPGPNHGTTTRRGG